MRIKCALSAAADGSARFAWRMQGVCPNVWIIGMVMMAMLLLVNVACPLLPPRSAKAMPGGNVDDRSGPSCRQALHKALRPRLPFPAPVYRNKIGIDGWIARPAGLAHRRGFPPRAAAKQRRPPPYRLRWPWQNRTAGTGWPRCGAFLPGPEARPSLGRKQPDRQADGIRQRCTAGKRERWRNHGIARPVLPGRRRTGRKIRCGRGR